MSGRKGWESSDDLIDRLEADALPKLNSESGNLPLMKSSDRPRNRVGALRYFLLKFTRIQLSLSIQEALSSRGERSLLPVSAVRQFNFS